MSMLKLKYPTLSNAFGGGASVGPTPPSYEPETTAFISRVEADGGKVLDPNALDAFYKLNKSLGLYSNLQFAVRKQFGYKVNEAGNIVKIYDASKNANDLDISRGTVAEDVENEMFFLNNTYFRDTSVTFDIIGDQLTYMTDILNPDVEQQQFNYISGFGNLWIHAGGSSLSRSLNLVNSNPVLRYRSGAESFTNANDSGVFRKLDYRHHKGVSQIIRKDGIDMGTSDTNQLANHSFDAPVNKIVYGGQTGEAENYDADAYLNRSYFYNKYLTDEQITEINNLI